MDDNKIEWLDVWLTNQVKEYVKDNTQDIVNAILAEITNAYIKGFDDGIDFIIKGGKVNE